MVCLKERGHQAEGCRSLAKLYLECRMERCGCQVLHQFQLQECHTRPSQHLTPYNKSAKLVHGSRITQPLEKDLEKE